MADEKEEQSFGLSSKKFLASAFASSSAGKSIILSVLGEEGSNLIHAIKSANKKHVDKDTAKTNKEAVLKMAMKVKLMFDEGKITVRDTQHAVEPINSLCRHLLHHFEPAEGKVDVQHLAANFGRVSFTLLDLIQPHMTQKNYDLARSVLQYFGSPAFLDFVINNPQCREEKEMIYASLRIMLAPLQVQFDLQDHEEKMLNQPCRWAECTNERLRPRGEFRGSDLCGVHHIEEYRRILEQPTLALFFKDKPSLSIFADFLHFDPSASPADKNAFLFVRAVEPYREYERGLRITRARIIYNKYLAPGASHGFLDEKADCLGSIEERLATGSRDVFEPSVAAAMVILGQAFERFLGSLYYQKFVASLQPPRIMLSRYRVASIIAYTPEEKKQEE